MRDKLGAINTSISAKVGEELPDETQAEVAQLRNKQGTPVYRTDRL